MGSEVRLTLDVVMRSGRPWRLVLEGVPRNARHGFLTFCGASEQQDGRITYALDRWVLEDVAALATREYATVPELTDAVRVWLEGELAEEHMSLDIAALPDMKWGHPHTAPLYPYQRVGSWWLKQVERGILGDEMGLGKTAQALFASSGARHILIVAPSIAKRSIWEKQIKQWMSRFQPIIHVAEGEGPARQLTLANATLVPPPDPARPVILIINPEMLRFPANRARFQSLWNRTWDGVILDEAQRYQDRNAQQSRGAAKLRTRRLYLLTGTPVWTRPENIWHLLHLIDPLRWSSYWAFVEEYCEVMVTPFAREIVGIKPWKLDRLQRTLAPVLLRREQKEALPWLPSATIQDIEYDLKPSQKAIYRQLKRKFVLTVGGKDTPTIRHEPNISKTFADLRRLCNAPVLADPAYEKEASAKDEVLDELINQAHGEGKQVVVFTWSRDYGEYLAHRFAERYHPDSVARLHGGMGLGEREEHLERFQNHKAWLMVGGVPVVSEAIDLTAGSVAIFAEGSYVPSQNKQAIARLHRIGQRDNVLVYRLAARGTVEEALWQIVDERTAQTDELLAFSSTAMRVLHQEDI